MTGTGTGWGGPCSCIEYVPDGFDAAVRDVSALLDLGLSVKVSLQEGRAPTQTHTQIYGQTSTYTDINSDIQTDKHLHRHILRYTDRQAPTQTYTQIYGQTSTYTDTHSDIRTDKHLHRHTLRYTDRLLTSMYWRGWRITETSVYWIDGLYFKYLSLIWGFEVGNW